MLIEKDSLYIYVPENYSGSLDAAVYYPGSGGAKKLGSADGLPYEEYIASNPDKVVVISKRGVENTDDIYNTLDEVKSANNISFRDVNFYSHSAGQSAMVNTASKAADYGYNAKFMTVLDSAYQLNTIHISDEEAAALAKNGTTAVFFDQTDYGRKNNLKTLISHGVPIVYVQCDADSSDWGERHKIINATPVKNGLIDFMSGDISSLGTTSGNINKYTYWEYDYNVNDWKQVDKEVFDQTISNKALAGKSKSGYITLEKRENIEPINPELFDKAWINSDGTTNIKIYKDELEAFLKSSCLACVSNDFNDAKNLQALIEEFKNNSVLSGDVWELAYKKLDIYEAALSKRILLMSELQEVINWAINELLTCMGSEYESMDTSELPELKETLKDLYTERSNILQSISNITTSSDSDSESSSESSDTDGTVSSADLLALLKLVEESIREVEKHIAALKALEEKYAIIMAKINATIAKVDIFIDEVNNIEPTEKYAYVTV